MLNIARKLDAEWIQKAFGLDQEAKNQGDLP